MPRPPSQAQSPKRSPLANCQSPRAIRPHPPLRTLGRSPTARALALLCFMGLGCAGRQLPDPKVTARAYASALERGDANAVYALLTPEAQRALGRSGTAQLIRESKLELTRAAASVSSPAARVEATAEARFSDGESAMLLLEDGYFRVDAASILPARPRTPTEALSGLRRALSRRSYPALMALLARDSSQAVESDIGSLVTGLEHPETLDIQVNGDNAEVHVPTGHVIKLKREAGVWRVLDFE
jgi:hypothetical protein